MFKRIRNIITPPPAPKEDQSASAPPPKEDEFETILPESVKTLINAPSTAAPEAQEALNTLKQVAKARGAYMTAARIRLQFVNRRSDSTTEEHVGRAYVLAADFIWQHMMTEIGAVEAKPVGPNIFRAYCNDLVDCLSKGKKIRRCIEVPVMVIDTLLGRSLDFPNHRRAYLDLAKEAALAAESEVRRRTERDDKSARKRMREQTDTDSGTDPDIEADTHVLFASDPNFTMDKHAVTCIENVLKSVEQIRECYEKNTQPPTEPITYYEDLLKKLDALPYKTFKSLLLERVGALLHTKDADMSREVFCNAATTLEQQCDAEEDVHLYKLCLARYKKMIDLYQRAEAPEKAERIKQQLQALQSKS